MDQDLSYGEWRDIMDEKEKEERRRRSNLPIMEHNALYKPPHCCWKLNMPGCCICCGWPWNPGWGWYCGICICWKEPMPAGTWAAGASCPCPEEEAHAPHWHHACIHLELLRHAKLLLLLLHCKLLLRHAVLRRRPCWPCWASESPHAHPHPQLGSSPSACIPPWAARQTSS